MTILSREPTTVLVADDELVVEHLRITDPDAVAFVAASDEPELTLVRCVEMGARVLRLANATVDTQVVEHRFDQMTQSLDRSVDELARRIDDSARALLDDENGELTAALRGWLADVTDTLGATFDESSKKSAIAKLEKLLESARAEQVASVRRLLDPDSDDSPLNRWRTEIVSEVRDRGEALERLVNDLSFRLGLDQGEAAALDRTAVKGFDFEDVVYATLESIAALRPGSSGDSRPRDPAPRQSNFRNSSRLTPDALMIAFKRPGREIPGVHRHDHPVPMVWVPEHVVATPDSVELPAATLQRAHSLPRRHRRQPRHQAETVTRSISIGPGIGSPCASRDSR